MILEACAGSARHAFAAAGAGVSRIELNSALPLGGLTPSPGTFTEVRQALSIPVLPMIRPREGGFCYDAAETASMLRDAEFFLDAGADGVVFGFLTEDGQVDAEKVRDMVRLAGNRQTVFHRAIDIVPDWRRALETLMELGVTRVLTGGQAKNAWDGRETLRQMRIYTEGVLEIQPAGGIRPGNAREILRHTGCTMLHMSGSCQARDPGWPKETGLWFSSPDAPDGGAYTDCDPDLFRQVLISLGDS